jgi:hypothetical protein
MVQQLEGCRVRVTSDRTNHQLNIRMNGMFPANRVALGMMRAAIREVNRFFRGVDAEECVPIPGEQCEPIPYDFLLRQEHSDDELLAWPGAKDKHKPSVLLNGVDLPGVRTNDEVPWEWMKEGFNKLEGLAIQHRDSLTKVRKQLRPLVSKSLSPADETRYEQVCKVLRESNGSGFTIELKRVLYGAFVRSLMCEFKVPSQRMYYRLVCCLSVAEGNPTPVVSARVGSLLRGHIPLVAELWPLIQEGNHKLGDHDNIRRRYHDAWKNLHKEEIDNPEGGRSVSRPHDHQTR